MRNLLRGPKALALLLLVLFARAVPATPVQPIQPPQPWTATFHAGAYEPGQFVEGANAERWGNHTGQQAATQAGPGQQVYWNHQIWGKPDSYDTLRDGGNGAIMLFASPLTARDKAVIKAHADAEDNTGVSRAAIDAAIYKSQWLEGTKQILPGQELRVNYQTSGERFLWAGPWGFNHTSGAPYFEVDIGETTINADGTATLRQVVKLSPSTHTGCISTIRRQIYDVAFGRDASGKHGYFKLNGKISCTVDLPDNVAQAPFDFIASLQIGGLAQPATVSSGTTWLKINSVQVGPAQ